MQKGTWIFLAIVVIMAVDIVFQGLALDNSFKEIRDLKEEISASKKGDFSASSISAMWEERYFLSKHETADLKNELQKLKDELKARDGK